MLLKCTVVRFTVIRASDDKIIGEKLIIKLLAM